jgi:hypothetical protein
MEQYAQKVIDSAGIVRDAIYQQLISVGLHLCLKAYRDGFAVFCRRFKLPLAYYADCEVIKIWLGAF